MTAPVAGIVKVDPPPVQVLPFHYNPEQYLRQMGTAIWEERPVDRGKSVLEYRGVSAHRLMLDLFFDGFRGNAANGYYGRLGAERPPRDVEAELTQLHRLAIPWVQGDTTSEPPKLQVRYGQGQQLRWVIADLMWGREVRLPDGRRGQATVTAELVEYTSATLVDLSPAERAEQDNAEQGGPIGRRPSGRTYTVRAGDTLSAIAARELGSAARFTEIAELNDLDDPDLITVGQVLTLPAA